MFKKCKESHCLNRQMMDFISRQLSSLKELAKKINNLSSEVVSDQILQSVDLMQKRIIFAIQEKPNQQFHDYVSDFYEDKLDKMRKQLSNEHQRNKRLESKIQDLQKSLKNSNENQTRIKPLDLPTLNQNYNIKNELIHSQHLIMQNQQIMEAQNNLINQLKLCVMKAEERQNQARMKFQQKGKSLDDAVNAKKKKTLELVKEFQNQTKRIDKDCRELELLNLSLVQEKDALQSEVILKSQEIKLLSKKIYDQNMLIGKYERELQFHEGILQEEKVDNNRAFEENKVLKLKLRDIEKDYQSRQSIKVKEIKGLQEKLLRLTSANTELQSLSVKYSSNCDKYGLELKQKRQEFIKLESQNSDLQGRLRQMEKQLRKAQKKSKQVAIKLKDYQQSLQQKEEQIKRYKQLSNRMKKDLQLSTSNFQREKDIIKQDLQGQFQRLITLNKEMLSSVQKTENQSVALKKELELLSSKNIVLRQNMQQLSDSFEEGKNMINKIEEEKHDLDYIREQLQIKIKHTERKCEELQKIAEEKNQNNRKIEQLQTELYQMKKNIKEKDAELEKHRKIITEYSVKKENVQTESVKGMKEELCRKQFMIRQLNSKLNEVQNELRQLSRKYEHEKESMTAQIKQMQKIIQDNFDHSNGSNRMIDLTYI